MRLLSLARRVLSLVFLVWALGAAIMVVRNPLPCPDLGSDNIPRLNL